MCISKKINEIYFTVRDFILEELDKRVSVNIQMFNYILNDNYLKLIFQLRYVYDCQPKVQYVFPFEFKWRTILQFLKSHSC